jgi:hypothetical protein
LVHPASGFYGIDKLAKRTDPQEQQLQKCQHLLLRPMKTCGESSSAPWQAARLAKALEV